MVALAILMPIVASMGGNAGTQTMTVAVRALATRDLDIYNVGRIIRREVVVGILNGAIFAMMMGAVATVWFASAELGFVIAAAMIVNMLAAAVAGIFVPLLLDRVGQDPAIASSIFVTTVTDVVGFFAFLGLAVWRPGGLALETAIGKTASASVNLLGHLFDRLRRPRPKIDFYVKVMRAGIMIKIF